MLGDVEVHNPAAMMREDYQDEQDLEPNCWHDKEIDRHQVPDMILQKCLQQIVKILCLVGLRKGYILEYGVGAVRMALT
jgi:hypothetical protein